MKQVRPNWQGYTAAEFPLGVDDLREWTRSIPSGKSVGQPGFTAPHPYGNWLGARLPGWRCEEVAIRPLDESERVQWVGEDHPVDCAFVRMVHASAAGDKRYRDYDLPDWAILLEEQMQVRRNQRTCHLQSGQLAALLAKRPIGTRVPAVLGGAPFPVFEGGTSQGLRWLSATLTDIRLAIREHLERQPRNYPFVDPRFTGGWLVKFGLLNPDGALLTPPAIFQEDSEESTWIVTWPAD